MQFVAKITNDEVAKITSAWFTRARFSVRREKAIYFQIISSSQIIGTHTHTFCMMKYRKWIVQFRNPTCVFLPAYILTRKWIDRHLAWTNMIAANMSMRDNYRISNEWDMAGYLEWVREKKSEGTEDARRCQIGWQAKSPFWPKRKRRRVKSCSD